MSAFVINSYAFGGEDADAKAYLDAVETADAQALEAGVRKAVDDFVKGCKADGIWTPIKACCILAGARTLTGALTPLVGPSPTNVSGNFVSGDYDRETGLLGNGSNKIIDTNVANNSTSVPQDNVHMAVYASTAPSSATVGAYGGSVGSAANGLVIFRGGGSSTAFTTSANSATRQSTTLSGTWPTGFVGVFRENSTEQKHRIGGTTYTHTVASTTRATGDIAIFSRSIAASIVSDGRYSFYSLGESLDLALLDTRVSTLMTDLAAAI